MNEYTEFIDNKCEHGIWNNPSAVKAITQELAALHELKEEEAETINNLIGHADNLLIEFAFGMIRIREVEVKGIGYPYSCMIFYGLGSISAMSPPLFSASFSMSPSFKQWLSDYLEKNDKAKWISEEAKQQSPVQQKKENAEEKKYKTIFNKYLQVYDDRFQTFFLDKTRFCFISDRDLPILADCIKSKLKKGDYENLLTNAYKILHEIDRHLPLKKVEQLFAEIKEGKTPDAKALYDNCVFESWEQKDQFKNCEMNSNNANEVKSMLKLIVDNIDDFFHRRRFFMFHLSIKDTSKKDATVYEDRIFEVAIQYPELESFVVQFVDKLTAYNRVYPIHYLYGYSVMRNMPVGHIAVASLAVYDNKKYDTQIVEFLQTLEHTDWFEQNCKEMRGFWKRNKINLDLPRTFAKYPQLVQNEDYTAGADLQSVPV